MGQNNKGSSVSISGKGSVPEKIEIDCFECGKPVVTTKITLQPDVLEGVFECPCGHNAIVSFRLAVQH